MFADAMLNPDLTKKEWLVGSSRAALAAVIMQWWTSGSSGQRGGHSQLVAQAFRADLCIFRSKPSREKGTKNIQGSPPLRSGMIHSNKAEIRQKFQETCVDEKGAPGQSQTKKWKPTEDGWKEGQVAWEELSQRLSKNSGMKLGKLKH